MADQSNSYPVKGIIKGMPIFREVVVKYIPELADDAALEALPDNATFGDLKTTYNLSAIKFGQMMLDFGKAAKSIKDMMAKEAEEFGVKVDLNAPEHQWSNTDEKIQKAAVDAIAKKYEGQKGNIIFYGPSNIQMWYSLEQDMLPYKAQNHGIGGCVDPEMMKWADRLLYPFEPAAVFFQTGSNDIANGLTLEQIKENKVKMYSMFLKNMPNTKLVVMSGLPLPSRQEFWAATVETNEMLRELCEKTDRMYFMDATDVMLSAEGPDNMKTTTDDRYFTREYFRMDGIHLNKKGHDVWTARMKETLEEIL